MSHKQLGQEQRYQIYALKKAEVIDTEIPQGDQSAFGP